MDKVETKLSRRTMLLVSGGAAAAAVGAFAAAPFRITIAQGVRDLLVSVPPRSTVSLASGSYEEWLAQVGSTFSIGDGSTIRLSGVRALPSGGTRPASVSRRSAFAAFFDPVGRATLAPDLIYTANHAQSGSLRMFLSAAPAASVPARMMAVFN